MLERRNSARFALQQTKVREKNGDYLFTFDAANVSEEGVFIINKICFNSQDHHSILSLTLPNGAQLKNITARIVRENRTGYPKGCAYEFLNLSEDARMELKKFLFSQAS